MTNKNHNKSKEEKRQMFFDMQEHPELYTDEQVDDLLKDEEIYDLFHDMSMVRMAMKKENTQEINVCEEWKKFADKEGFKSDNECHSNSFTRTFNNRWKIAASIIGVIFVSGLAFATIHSGIFSSTSSSDVACQTKTEQIHLNTTDSIKPITPDKEDSLAPKPVVFENVELESVVSQLAAFYHVKVEFENTESRHFRIFFNWDKTKTLKQNIEILNAFERIHITETDGTLKVE